MARKREALWPVATSGHRRGDGAPRIVRRQLRARPGLNDHAAFRAKRTGSRWLRRHPGDRSRSARPAPAHQGWQLQYHPIVTLRPRAGGYISSSKSFKSSAPCRSPGDAAQGGHRSLRDSGSVSERGFELGPSQDRVFDQHGARIRLARQVFDPHGHLPHVGAADQSGASTGGSVAEGDQGMLIAPDRRWRPRTAIPPARAEPGPTPPSLRGEHGPRLDVRRRPPGQ